MGLALFRNLQIDKIKAGDTRAIARAATLIENRHPDGEKLLQALFFCTNKANTWGITGPPGAGKSTLVDQFTRVLYERAQKVGILAVDPTSPYSGGAVLGDRIRMQDHHATPGIFIRSMASRGKLGGLAAATGDLALLFAAAGMDTILIETVGVGQDEIDIARLADVTAVVLVPGMGDDVQAIKAGIMEIADVYIINKADQPGAEKLEREIQFLLSLSHRPDGWIPPIVRCIATEGQGITEALAAMDSYLAAKPKQDREVEKWSRQMREMLREKLLRRVESIDLQSAAADVAARRKDPYTAVNEWLHAN
jgi:LAO/AO transport system kinase